MGRVRRFVADEVAPRAAGIDRENEFPGDVYRRMGEKGLLGLARPQGAGKTTLEWAVWIEGSPPPRPRSRISCAALTSSRSSWTSTERKSRRP